MTHPSSPSEASAELPFSLLDALHVAVVVHAPDGAYLSSNAKADELLLIATGAAGAGTILPAAELLCREDGTPLPPGEHPVALAIGAQAQVQDITLGIRRPRGEVVWMLASAGPHRDPDGHVDRIVASYVDITERKRAELALRDQEIRYRTLFETMDSAVLLMRGAECFDCNPATVSLFGVERTEDLLGKTPLDFAPEYQPNGMRSAEMVQQNVELAARNGTHRFEWLSHRADGEPFVMEVSFTPFAWGDGDLFQCIARDISERKRAEDALRHSEARFRNIIEHAAEGILVAETASRRFRYANPEICRMLGYDATELLTLSVSDIHPGDSLDHVQGAFQAQAGGAQLEVEAPCLRKDGSIVDVRIRAVPVELDGVPCLIGFFRDESTERLLEQERIKTQKLEALGTLAGGIAHDFNNLLQGVFGFVSLAKQLREQPDRCAAMLDEAEAALHRTVGLTTQLLTFSRGGRPLKKLTGLGETVASAARFALSGSKVDSKLDLPPDLWSVEADEGQIGQVIQNIVINADQAMPLGGTIEVTLRNVWAPDPTSPPQLPPGDWIAIAIRDTGIGIAPDCLGRIFDPYFTTKDRGSGLGLATSYSIVKGHGGFIDVQSELGHGSTFTIYLPAKRDAAPTRASSPALEGPRAARVLVMDDDPMVQRAVSSLLAALGHDVETAAHGAEAIEMYQRAGSSGRPFEVVILDLTVRGGMGGRDALARLLEIDPKIRAIVSSGYSDDSAVAEFRTHGFSAVLHKPFTLDDLRRALRSVLE